MISRNVRLGKPLKISSWRKIAMGSWRTAGDPSVYGILELDATNALEYIDRKRKESGKRITLTHFVGKAVAETFRRHPEINVIMRFGRLYPRESVDIFFQVAADDEGKDLSGMTVRAADTKPLVDIATEMETRVALIKSNKDKSFTKMKGTMGLLPGFMASFVINLTGWLMYGLNIWMPLFGTPKDPFGSAMVTNIGSLGLDMAFAPLVPYSRVPLLVAVGAAREQMVVRDHKPVVAPCMKLCVTFDHRLIDGMHAAKMSRTMQKIFANPEAELS